jgi:two-component system nitrogen regulation response regulator GlnG
MPTTLRELDTLDFSDVGPASRRRVVGLTLLNHPDPSRIGQIGALFPEHPGGKRRISRSEPSFSCVGQDGGEALATPLVSRKNLVVRTARPGEVRVEFEEPSLKARVNGEPLTGAYTCNVDELESGVVIELGAFVVLLLHFVDGSETPAAGSLLGESRAIRAVKDEIRRVADAPTDVLIRGASGTGKELVARAIHEHSPRSGAPFVAVNMAAIPESMGASALFGHVRGAFTGAAQKNDGIFVAANGGTLFLDEIGETPRGLQGSLLRALREGQIQPVGATSTLHVDVRVLTATDAPLESLTEAGEFSLALLKRIDSYTITLPPLRRRRDDIARLFLRFFREQLDQFGEGSRLATSASDRPLLPGSFIGALVRYDFPGNVAELKALAVRTAISVRGSDTFRWDEHLRRVLNTDASALRPLSIAEGPSGSAAERALQPGTASVATATPLETRPSKRPPQSLTDEEIALAMRQAQFKPGAAAKALGVSRAWLFTRLENCEGVRLAKHLSEEELTRVGDALSWSVPAMAESLEVSLHGLRLRLGQLGLRQFDEDSE